MHCSSVAETKKGIIYIGTRYYYNIGMPLRFTVAIIYKLDCWRVNGRFHHDCFRCSRQFFPGTFFRAPIKFFPKRYTVIGTLYGFTFTTGRSSDWAIVFNDF